MRVFAERWDCLLVAVSALVTTFPFPKATGEISQDNRLVHILEFATSVAQLWNYPSVTLIDVFNDFDNFDETLINFIQKSKIYVNVVASSRMNREDLEPLESGGFAIIGEENVPKAGMMLKSSGLLNIRPIFFLEEQDWNSFGLRLDSSVHVINVTSSRGLYFDEIYSIKGGPYMRRYVGSWDIEKGLDVPVIEKWDRRRDLEGTVIVNTLLKVISLPITVVNTDENGVINETFGYGPDYLWHMSEILNFRIEHVRPPTPSFGAKLQNGSWSGLIGMLVRKEADVCVAGLTITEQRADAVDFTLPFFEEPITLIMQKPSGTPLNIWAFMMALDLPAWFVLACVIIALAVGLVLISKSGVERLHHSKDSENFGFFNGMAYVVIAIMYHEYNVSRKTVSAKILTLVVSLFGFFAFACYSAVMTSAMTVLQPPIKIHSILDIFDLDIKVVTLKDSSIETILKEAPEGSPLHKMYHENMLPNPDGMLTSIGAIFDSILTNPNNALFGPGLMSYSNDVLVELDLLETINSYAGIALQKDSEFLDMFNFYMMKMKQSGIFKRIHDEWFNKTRTDYSARNSMATAFTLDYNNVLFPYLIFVIGTGFALVLVCFEVVGYNTYQRYKSNDDRLSKSSAVFVPHDTPMFPSNYYGQRTF